MTGRVFFTFVSGRACVGPVEENLNGRLKQFGYHRSLPYVSGVHRVEEILRLVDLIGIPRAPTLVCPSALSSGPERIVAGDYAVIHAAPMFRYKQWTESGWRELAAALSARGLSVIATGSPAEAECCYLDNVWSSASVPVRRVDGRLDWPQLAGLLSKARVYIGPDTSVTHLAAASGCPTVAL